MVAIYGLADLSEVDLVDELVSVVGDLDLVNTGVGILMERTT